MTDQEIESKFASLGNSMLGQCQVNRLIDDRLELAQKRMDVLSKRIDWLETMLKTGAIAMLLSNLAWIAVSIFQIVGSK